MWVASFLRMALRVEKDATHSELFRFAAGTLRALGLAPPWPSLWSLLMDMLIVLWGFCFSALSCPMALRFGWGVLSSWLVTACAIKSARSDING